MRTLQRRGRSPRRRAPGIRTSMGVGGHLEAAGAYIVLVGSNNSSTCPGELFLCAGPCESQPLLLFLGNNRVHHGHPLTQSYM